MMPKPGGLRRPALIPAAVFLAAAAIFVKDNRSLLGFPLDDAWIHRVYSRSIACGRGFSYNDGSQEAGSTAPLWAVVTAPAHWLEPLGVAPAVALVKIIGVLCAIVAVLAVGSLARRVSGSRAVGWLAASLFALEPRLLFSAFSGMETTLLVALWAGGCAALSSGRPLLPAVLFGLAAVTRPEAIVLLPLALPGLLGLWRGRRRGQAVLGAAVALLPAALWAAHCRLVSGHFLPNTFYLKASPFRLGAQELETAWRLLFLNALAPPAACAIGVCGAVAAVSVSGERRGGALALSVLAGSAAAFLCAVVGTRPISLEGYYWTRWADPAAILLMAPFCIGLATLASLAVRGAGRVGFRAAMGATLAGRGRLRALAGAAALTGIALSIPAYARSFADRRGHLSSDSRAIGLMNVQAGEWIREHTPPEAVVGVNDAGAIRYFGRRRTIDLMGLNNAGIAFDRTTPEQALSGLDWIAVFPAWFQDSPLMPRIAAEFQVRHRLNIPQGECTIAPSAGLTLLVIAERRR